MYTSPIMNVEASWEETLELEPSKISIDLGSAAKHKSSGLQG